MTRIGFFDTCWQDLRYSLRGMRQNPAFAFAALLILALGVSGSTAMFTLVRSVLLQPLPYRDPDRLVFLSAENFRRSLHDLPFTETRLEQMRAGAHSFSGIGAFLNSAEDVTLSGAGDPETLRGARVSANFLTVLGVQPSLGRSFLPEEDLPSGAPVAMMSASLWRRRFNCDPHVIGQTVTLNSTPHTLIGILPANFSFPFADVDIWVPRPSEWSRFPPRYWRTITLLKGFARLSPGVTLTQAQDELNILNSRYLAAHPDFGAVPGVTMRVLPLKERLIENIRPMLLFLLGAVTLVLLIACSNVAGLTLIRLASRSREFALRAALGAGRGILMRQLLTESLLYSVAGGLLGTVGAKYILIAVSRSAALSTSTRVGALAIPGAGAVAIDPLVLMFAVALSVATGVVFGLFPSLGASNPNLVAQLRENGASASQLKLGRGVGFTVSARSLLVVLQLALSITLLICAALLVKSIARLHAIDVGFRSDGLLTMKIALPVHRYDTGRKRAIFYDQLTMRVEQLPGVDAAAIALSLPTTPWIWTDIHVEGKPPVNPEELPSAQLQSVTPGYFGALGIRLERGRGFMANDNSPGAPPTVIINEAFARRFWPAYPAGQNPIGLHLSESADTSAGSLEIIGIASNVHEGGLNVEPLPEFYVPLSVHPPQTAYLAVRAQGNASRLNQAIRMQMLVLDPDQPFSDVMSMQDRFQKVLGDRHLAAVLLQSFAALALLLALVGFYGSVAYSTAQRTREIGIRRALGAQRQDVLVLVLRHSLTLIIPGSVLGVGGALALGRSIKGLLFGVHASDPVTFCAVVSLFTLAAILASLLPGYRAARTEPLIALQGRN